MNICATCKHSMPGHPRWSSHYRACNHPNVSIFEEGEIIFGLEYEEEARDMGWFEWPFNFDPNALKKCKGYTEGD